MTIPLDEELRVLVIVDPVHIPAGREQVIPDHQVVPLLLAQVPHGLPAFQHHQIVPERVVVRRLDAPGLEPHDRRCGCLPDYLHRPPRDHVDGIQLPALRQATDRAGGGIVRLRGRRRADLGRFDQGSVEELLEVVAPGLVAGCGAGGLEGGVQPGAEDLHGGPRRRGEGGDGEDVGVVDGPGVDGVGDGEAGRRERAGELVGEDGDAGAGAAGDEAPGPGSSAGGDAAADVGGDGVVGAGAEVLHIDVQGVPEVGDEGVLERSAERVGRRDDFGGAGGGGGGIGHRRRRRRLWRARGRRRMAARGWELKGLLLTSVPSRI